MIAKIIAMVIVGGVLFAWLGAWVLILPLLFLVFWLIRIFADIFWWGKNKGKW